MYDIITRDKRIREFMERSAKLSEPYKTNGGDLAWDQYWTGHHEGMLDLLDLIDQLDASMNRPEFNE